MSLKLYFLRHGQTTFSRANAFCGSGLNPELTEDGAAMASAFAAFYAETAWRAVYCSSLQRAILTAKPLCDALQIQPELRSDLQEISYGKWEGQSVESVDRDFHDDYIRWSSDPAWNAPTGGETGIAIAQRALRTVEEIRGRYHDGNVLIVSHKATIRIVLCSLLGIDVGRFRFRLGCPVGSLSVVEFGAHGPLLQVLSDRTHLDERLRSLPGT
ncbi:putative phosphoglycerate mutase [Abditibacterium utsteinense]|uniref:Putative phosphoglycerate mutase n=1 Tax=Abditibacterium utsteinense TaxID=1960156 RepID=A0A2S8SUH3_9BACT|nr:histidine phosphatase family protein [Abditibacterium utsteinense]PQV64444.1 putative phosphoglycerate mutase [Abditibacterium utsteinense]